MFDNATAESGADASTVGYSLTDFSDGPQPHSQPWDTSDPFFSASTRVLLQRVLKCYVRQPIVFVGIPGNVLCCAVFLKQGLSDRINLLLFWLAVADLTNLAAQLLLMPGCYLADPLHVANWSVIANTKIAPINWCLTFVSGMLVLLLSVDRCISVVVPFKAQRFLTYRSTVAAIFISYLLPMMVFQFYILAFTVSWRTDPSTNRSIAYRSATSWFPFESTLASDVIFYFALLTKPVFLVVMVVCCTVTVLHLRRASRARVKMGGNVTEKTQSGETRITIMLMGICCAYIFLTIPETGAALISIFVSEYHAYRKYHNSFLLHYQFIWIASCTNAAINFVPYLLLSARFKKTLQELFVCCE